MSKIEETQTANKMAREDLQAWRIVIAQNCYLTDKDFQHSIHYYFDKKHKRLDKELTAFADKVISELEALVIENNLPHNLPHIEHYDGIGNRIEKIIHHPNYIKAGDIIYGSKILERMAKTGGLLEALVFMFLSSQAGEAGHNCPLACTAGIIRVFQKLGDFPQKEFYLQKLLSPSFCNNFTGAQFLTEIQGGSDVGRNATMAYMDDQQRWRIRGEKWFCSNADADLILMTARFDEKINGTKGLGLFLVPALLQTGERNHYTVRRLKDKIGTRSMASAEIDFHDAIAIPMGLPAEGFKMVMENVLHLSRLFNTFCMLGMARRAYFIADSYARHRVAFDQPIIHYALVQENLARIKAENTAMLAAIFTTTQLQDHFDLNINNNAEMKLLLRLLANLNKYLSALWSVEHIHHALDVLAGNGAIESFSVIPRLLRDSIVCENWEGTHNTLRMQILKDIARYQIDTIFIHYLSSSLKPLKSSGRYYVSLEQGMIRLKEELSVLKNAPLAVQELQIKVVVDLMAVLFSAVQLLREAFDQAKIGQHTKLYCLDYFMMIHIEGKPIKYNESYIELISKVIGK